MTDITEVLLFRRPWWEKDPEVAAFVRTLFGNFKILDMPGEVAKRFSPERAPSKSGIWRFMNALRGRPQELTKKKKRRRQRAKIPIKAA